MFNTVHNTLWLFFTLIARLRSLSVTYTSILTYYTNNKGNLRGHAPLQMTNAIHPVKLISLQNINIPFIADTMLKRSLIYLHRASAPETQHKLIHHPCSLSYPETTTYNSITEVNYNVIYRINGTILGVYNIHWFGCTKRGTLAWKTTPRISAFCV